MALIKCPECGKEFSDQAAACPNCGYPMEAKGKKVKPQKEKKKGSCLVSLIFVIVFVGSLFAIFSGDSKDSSDNSSIKTEITKSANGNLTTSSEETPTPIPYISVSVSQLMDELDNNAASASATYKGKYLEVTGLLTNIDSDCKYISLDKDEYSIIGVQCYVKSDDQKQQVLSLSKGQNVTVKGKCTSVGEVLGYALDIEEIVQ